MVLVGIVVMTSSDNETVVDITEETEVVSGTLTSTEE